MGLYIYIENIGRYMEGGYSKGPKGEILGDWISGRIFSRIKEEIQRRR